jgi:acetolactate synthase-1/2/3 large subunit
MEELKKKATPKFKEAAAKRVEALSAERKAWRETATKLATNKGKEGEINPHYIFAELNKLLKPDDLVFNEGVRNAGAVLMQLERPNPNTCVRSGGGGLGWSGGMALGAKLAAPDKMVVQVVGDGGFYFGGPSSVFAVAKQYSLPILVLLLDNTGWSAVKESTLRVFPQGTAKATDKFQAGLMPDAEFSKIGEAFGAYGEKVTNPEEIPAALARAVKEVRGGRAAILHIRVTKL